MQNSPDADPKGDVWEEVWVLVDPVDRRDRHLRPLHSVLLPESSLNSHLFSKLSQFSHKKLQIFY